MTNEILAAVAIAYLLPSFMASSRKHPNTVAIFALNLLLDWTFLGWVCALVWSVTAQPLTGTEQAKIIQ